MPVTESIGRRHCIPIIYTRGTHYEVGFDIGRTFSGLIHNFLGNCTTLHDDFLPAYATPEGRRAYEDTLETCQRNFPQYVRELEGTADGAKVPFHKLFLLHLDEIILSAVKKPGDKQPVGCSSICVNEKGQEILGHTEDALAVTLNNFYLVSAHIIEDKPQGRWQVKEEKFTSLSYAGHLPGYTMSYNHHGLVFTINTLWAKELVPGKTPRQFLTRALLSAENFQQAQQILHDSGCGAGNGCSVNLTFLLQEGDRLFHNIEMAPAVNSNESELSVRTITPGENNFHCNAYLRLDAEKDNEPLYESSLARMEYFQAQKKPQGQDDVRRMLGDQSNCEWPVFWGDNQMIVRTIATGIFDCNKKTWTLYRDNPKKYDALFVLSMQLKNKH